MTIRIGINGFGRIGKTVTRIMQARGGFSVVAINDLTSPEQLAHGLKYDSVYGRFAGEIALAAGGLVIDGQNVRITAEKDPEKLDWAGVGADIILEATGVFRKREPLERHLTAGAKRVLLSVPAKDKVDATIVMGVNDEDLTADARIISNASCTTNAAAPITKIIHDAFGIERGVINTIHAYTNDQRLMDFPHKDWRRSRAAALSIIPTTTGAARAVAKVIPALAGKLDGGAYRVPVPTGSIVDMTFILSRDVTVDAVNAAVEAASGSHMKGIVCYQTDPIVSQDIVADSHSSIFDAALTQVVDGRMLKVASWYDNEWGYSARMVDLAQRVAEFDR